MSKIGKRPIEIPEDINVSIKDTEIVVSNGSDETTVNRLSGVGIKKEDGKIIFSLEDDSKQSKSNWGTLRSLINNAIKGLTDGFEKQLVLKGVGYRVAKEGNGISLTLGFSHPIKYEKPEGIEFEIEGKNKLTVKGKDKELVGQVAADIKKMRPVEPYKGKGIRYKGQYVRRKVGKKATGEGVGE